MAEELDGEALRGELARAADMEPGDAQLATLVLLGQACLESTDLQLVAQGRDVLLNAAAAGSPEAAWLASYALFAGVGGDTEPQRALSLLEGAARAGVVEAAFELGQLLLRADERDTGLPWVAQAAERGFGPALRLLGRVAVGDGELDDARALLDAAVEAGEPRAVYDRLLLLAQAGPTEALARALDVACGGGALPIGLLGEIGRAVAARDPERLFDVAVPVTAQALAGRRAFLDGATAGAASVVAGLQADLLLILDL